jgi:hypothetical protein
MVIGDIFMAYRDQLYPWCIVRSVSNAQTTVVARFRRRTDAEAHLRILRRTHPNFAYHILFEKVSIADISSDAAIEDNPVDEERS